MTVSKAEYDAMIVPKDGKINALQYQLDQLRRLIFAYKSERFAPASAPEQLTLWDGDLGADAGAKEVKTQSVAAHERKVKKVHPGHTKFPNHLPVRQEIIEPEEDTTGMGANGKSTRYYYC